MTNTSGPAQPAAIPSPPVPTAISSAGRCLLYVLAAVVVLAFAVPALITLVVGIIP